MTILYKMSTSLKRGFNKTCTLKKKLSLHLRLRGRWQKKAKWISCNEFLITGFRAAWQHECVYKRKFCVYSSSVKLAALSSVFSFLKFKVKIFQTIIANEFTFNFSGRIWDMTFQKLSIVAKNVKTCIYFSYFNIAIFQGNSCCLNRPFIGEILDSISFCTICFCNQLLYAFTNGMFYVSFQKAS